ncbi:MAG TPA: cupredoxin domain-containing protein [Xanthobacteraceae bacterium]|jgi:hypothetical protein
MIDGVGQRNLPQWLTGSYTLQSLARLVLRELRAAMVAGAGLHAQQAVSVAISVKDHHFQPAEVHAPANRPLTIKVSNLGMTPMEFESVSLRVEKVISPGSSGVVTVRPLSPGSYEFYDDFDQQTRGSLVVR